MSCRTCNFAPPVLRLIDGHSTVNFTHTPSRRAAACDVFRNGDATGGASQQGWKLMASDMADRGFTVTADALYAKFTEVKKNSKRITAGHRGLTGSGMDGAPAEVVSKMLEYNLLQAAMAAEASIPVFDGDPVGQRATTRHRRRAGRAGSEEDGSSADEEDGGSDDDEDSEKGEGGGDSDSSYEEAKSKKNDGFVRYTRPSGASAANAALAQRGAAASKKASTKQAAAAATPTSGAAGGAGTAAAAASATAAGVAPRSKFLQAVTATIPAAAAASSSGADAPLAAQEQPGPPHVRGGSTKHGRVIRHSALAHLAALMEARPKAAPTPAPAPPYPAPVSDPRFGTVISNLNNVKALWTSLKEATAELAVPSVDESTVIFQVENIRQILPLLAGGHRQAAMALLRSHQREEVRSLATDE